MNEKENKNEQNNSVVEAMLRAREKEMQQPPADEELPGLTSEEYDDMYLKIIGRLKAEGLMQEEHAADSEMKAADTEEEKVSRVVAFEDAAAKKQAKTTEKIPIKVEEMEEKTQKEPEKMTEENMVEKDSEKRAANRRPEKIRWFQKKAAKVACVCLVAAAAMFGLSMTSEANRLRLLQTANEVLGTGDLLKTNNGDDRAMTIGSEYEARQEITDTLHVEIPQFLYLPEGMEYITYELIDDVGYAKIHYSYKRGYLYLEISNSLSDMSQGSIEENQENDDMKEEIETLSGKISFTISAMEGKTEQYTASWQYKNASYLLWGEIDKEEMKKILENISYEM